MFNRKKIGSSRAESPAMKVHRYLSGFVLKMIFSIILTTIILLVFNYFVFNFINFILVNVSQSHEISRENPYFITVEIFAALLGNYIILRDRLSRR